MAVYLFMCQFIMYIIDYFIFHVSLYNVYYCRHEATSYTIWRGHSSCFWAPARPSSGLQVSPRPRHGAGGPASRQGYSEQHKNPPKSKSLYCASDCVWSSCKAEASLPGSPGLSPPHPAPSGSPRSAGGQPQSPVAALPSRSALTRSEACLQQMAPYSTAINPSTTS